MTATTAMPEDVPIICSVSEVRLEVSATHVWALRQVSVGYISCNVLV